MSTSVKTQLFIGNRWLNARSGDTFELINPANEEVQALCASAQAEDVDDAVEAARKCFEGPAWGLKSSGKKRAECLNALAKAIETDKQAFSRMEASDCGKPIKECDEDMDMAVECLRFYAELAENLDTEEPETVEVSDHNFETRVLREPLGVVGAITPWNYPLLMGVQKIAPALAAGCTVVLKPSELAPLTCLRLAGLAESAGLPAGALNVITGLGDPAGAELSRHSGLDKVTFTGSVATGKKVMSAAAAGPCGAHLELGGKSAMIVFDDVEDIDATVDWICCGIFLNSGQVCSATSRLLVHANIREKIVRKLLDFAARVSVGEPLRGDGEEEAPDGTPMGPLVSGSQRDKVMGFIERAVESGAEVLCGGGPPSDEEATVTGRTPGKGFYICPTILAGIKENDEAWNEEIFGPVLCVREFKEEQEAILAANNSKYGLAAAVVSADKNRCERVARALRAGIVWKNCSQPTFVQAPWGGFKQSGYGRELGRWGLDEFMGVKQITSCNGKFSWQWYSSA